MGGGSQVALLNRLTAAVTGCEVVAGPTEATLFGNLLVQAEGLGCLGAGERRAVVRRSSRLARFSNVQIDNGQATYKLFQRFGLTSL